MKRIAVIATTLAIVGSLSAVAFADDTVEPEGETTPALAAAQMRKAELIADYFADVYVVDAPTEDATACDADCAAEGLTETIVTLREGEPSIGWGALYKLMQIAAVTGQDINELIAASAGDDGEYDFSFGELRKSLTEEQLAALEDMTKNLGQLKKQAREPKQNRGQAKKNNG